MTKCTKECLTCHKHIEPLEQICPYCAGKSFAFPTQTHVSPAEKAMEQAYKFERMGDLEKAQDWLNKAISLEQKYGVTGTISFSLYCPRCDQYVSNDLAKTDFESYDDGWFTRYKYFCLRCDSQLFGPDGKLYQRNEPR